MYVWLSCMCVYACDTCVYVTPIFILREDKHTQEDNQKVSKKNKNKYMSNPLYWRACVCVRMCVCVCLILSELSSGHFWLVL